MRYRGSSEKIRVPKISAGLFVFQVRLVYLAPILRIILNYRQLRLGEVNMCNLPDLCTKGLERGRRG